MVKIIPLQDKVLLKKVEEKPKEEVVKGGIIIPSDDKAIVYGEVIDISKDIKDPKIKVGDKVIFSEYAGKDFEIDEEKYVLISYKEISGIIEF